MGLLDGILSGNAEGGSPLGEITDLWAFRNRVEYAAVVRDMRKPVIALLRGWVRRLKEQGVRLHASALGTMKDDACRRHCRKTSSI